jgi:hypothetical protein
LTKFQDDTNSLLNHPTNSSGTDKIHVHSSLLPPQMVACDFFDLSSVAGIFLTFFLDL